MGQQSLISSLSAFELKEGSAFPLGATLQSDGCNFSVYAPDAEDVIICLFDKNEQSLAQITLQQRVQSRWFGFISNVSTDHLYGLRVKPKSSRRVHPESSINKLLIDPYAKSLNRPLNWSSHLYEGDSSKMIPKAHIIESSPNQYQPIKLLAKKRVIYEAHVKGLTKLHPEVPEKLRGTYLGACEPAILKHLGRLGVTSVQFLPLMTFMPESFVTDKGLTNYWGYNPINFFAPEPRYALHDALSECKEMIAKYREANFEVILDVVFNHTSEGGSDGPVLSFKGLCEYHAYLQEQNDETDSNQYVNYSGCGNTLKVSDPFVMQMVIDALRYWVTCMGVSGFRFDLASIVGREVFEFKNTATFFKILRQDPILKSAVMLAEPWDIGPGGYQLGQYPDYWLEVNDKFRDVVRGFWRGDKGLKSEFATRFMGSRDVFRKNVRPMHASVNNVSYHDGYTLHDIVTYQDKHNLANLEDNKDGHNHNLSANYGHEGETDDPAINQIRDQQKRNLFATLLLSQGTPHILGGDELSKSQLGNNNAYCQDNELNWYNWDLLPRQKAFLTYCQYVVNLRQDHSLLQHMNFFDDVYDNQQNIIFADWYRRDGSHKRDIDWVNHEHHCFALHIAGEGNSRENSQLHKQEWLFVVNSLDQDVMFNLPMLEQSNEWVCVLNTSEADTSLYATQLVKSNFNLPARSFLVFCKR